MYPPKPRPVYELLYVVFHGPLYETGPRTVLVLVLFNSLIKVFVFGVTGLALGVSGRVTIVVVGGCCQVGVYLAGKSVI